jgi:hypothetical protein
MSEFLYEDLTNTLGYVKQSGKPKPGHVPVALLRVDGRPIFSLGLNRIPDNTLQRLGWIRYDDEVERQRRLLTDTALAHLGLERPQCVQTAVDLVGKGVRNYWANLATGTDSKTIEAIATNAGNRIYGKTSFGRRDPTADAAAASSNGSGADLHKAQVGQWFSPLDKTPRDVPKLMSLYDYFYCKVLGGTATSTAPALIPNPQLSQEYQRAENKKATWRPAWYEKPGPRGRSDPKRGTPTTDYPGLLSADFTIPVDEPLQRCGLDMLEMQLEARNRGWDMYSIQAKDMDAGFKQSLTQHNLPFSASASGTTSTLFLAAEAFASISSFPMEEQKQLGVTQPLEVAYSVWRGKS